MRRSSQTSKNTWELPPDADKTKNPVPSSEESIAKAELYAAKTETVFSVMATKVQATEATLPVDETEACRPHKQRAHMAAMSDGELFWKISKASTE